MAWNGIWKTNKQNNSTFRSAINPWRVEKVGDNEKAEQGCLSSNPEGYIITWRGKGKPCKSSLYPGISPTNNAHGNFFLIQYFQDGWLPTKTLKKKIPNSSLVWFKKRRRVSPSLANIFLCKAMDSSFKILTQTTIILVKPTAQSQCPKLTQ